MQIPRVQNVLKVRGEKMKLLLKLDYDGNPYIVLVSHKSISLEGQCIEDELLERFVELAFRNGVEIKRERKYYRNEADLDTRVDYASIRIKKPA